MRSIYYNQVSRENFGIICKEILMTIPVVIYMRKDFYLLDALNEKIKALKAAGLIEFWNYENIDKKLIHVRKENEPKILTVDLIIGCFYLLFFGMVLSVLAYLLEIMMLKVR
jgi:hypothetical protein